MQDDPRAAAGPEGRAAPDVEPERWAGPEAEAERWPGPAARRDRAVDFEFGAGFRLVRVVDLALPDASRTGARPTGLTILPTVTGEFWIADPDHGEIQVFAPDGGWLRTLGRERTGLIAPVGVTGLYGRWVAVLDGAKPQVAVLDESGWRQRRFWLPEVDRGRHICNVGDRWLAVAGDGWGPGDGRMIHIYSADGLYVDSLFAVPRRRTAERFPVIQAFEGALYVSHPDFDSFAIYELETRAVLAFPDLAARERAHDPDSRYGARVGFFVTQCGEVLAVYRERGPGASPSAGADGSGDSSGGGGGGGGDGAYLYDLYALSGAPIVRRLRIRERIVALEGPFFYSLETGRDGRSRLRVWKLRYAPIPATGPRPGGSA